MKKIIMSALLIALLGINAFAAVYIKYYNKDSVKHVFTVKMDGQTKQVTFNASTSGATSIGGSGTKAIVTTKCGDVEVANDSKIEIKDGCIKFVK
jgi:hypothetical protein